MYYNTYYFVYKKNNKVIVQLFLNMKNHFGKLFTYYIVFCFNG
jgi:hypothetical protein